MCEQGSRAPINKRAPTRASHAPEHTTSRSSCCVSTLTIRILRVFIESFPITYLEVAVRGESFTIGSLRATEHPVGHAEFRLRAGACRVRGSPPRVCPRCAPLLSPAILPPRQAVRQFRRPRRGRLGRRDVNKAAMRRVRQPQVLVGVHVRLHVARLGIEPVRYVLYA